MPKLDTDGKPPTTSFTNIKNRIACPFVIYADFEALLIDQKIEENLNFESSYTVRKNNHEACSYGYKVVCHDNDKLSKPFKMFRGKDAITKFIEALFEEEKEIIDHMKKFKKADIIMKRDQVEKYKSVTNCYICDGEFTDDNKKVRDHCHVSGKYRGAAHDKCNLKLTLSSRIPVVFHNLKGYDSHHIMQKIGQFKTGINIIPNNMEKYTSFSIGTERMEWDYKEKKLVNKVKYNLTFLDSFQFMSSSLSNLIDDLKKSDLQKFKYAFQEFGSLTRMMTRKGIYPYTYMNNWHSFVVDPRNLNLDHFTNDLTGDKITDKEFKFFQEICEELKIKDLGEYHDLYLKTDVLLLCDVFENFRKTCLEYYGLDPAHYYTAPGLSWDACLKMTGVKLELLTDSDMHLFVEKGLRGGVSIITHRKGTANNKYMTNYDKNKSSQYITYYDANNLYGWAMSQTMPYGEFKWSDPEKYVLPDYKTLCSNNLQKGNILEVDLDYPKELHDLHNEYPYCPEQVKVTDEMFSSYTKKIANDHKLKTGKYTKLIPNLNNKEKYVIHERNLRQAIDAGLVLRKIHRVLEFDQKSWIKKYVDFNTKMRQLAKNDFEKNFFKLMNNSFFGKTMENKRKRVNVKLINDRELLIKYLSKPTFINCKIFNEQLVAVHCIRETIKLDKPIYVGFCILDISKTLMYDFHYNHIKRNYGCKAKLLFTDTDSLCYEIHTEDVFQDMYDKKYLFDLSEITHDKMLKFKDMTNKKVIGKMKPEYADNVIHEFIGLRSKMYSIKFNDGKECKTAKGVVRSVIRNDIKHEKYRDILETGEMMHSKMTVIRSQKHQLYTMEMNKVSLSAYDDKRWIKNDGISSYAYGHYKTR